MLTPRRRMLNVLEGKPVDRFPVAVPYIFLLQCDHWCEITGQPAWTYYAWLAQEPAEHVKAYRTFDQELPFDILQPQEAPSREERENLDIVHRDDKHYFCDRRTGELTRLDEDLPHSADVANQARYVYDRGDVDQHVRIQRAPQLLKDGKYDHIMEASRAFSKKLLMNGVVGTFWQCHWHVGLTNLFGLLYDDPDLIHYLSAKLLEKTIERIRALAAAGDDAIYIDDALTTNDMISPGFYERFSLPYVKEMVDEIHALGKKAIVIYFGGVADRIPQIMSLGADALSFETSMKSYVNDLDRISSEVGDRICLWGNIDPVSIVQDGTEQELREAIAEQAEIGRRGGRFIISTGSPITPLTPLARIRRFIDLGRELGTPRHT